MASPMARAVRIADGDPNSDWLRAGHKSTRWRFGLGICNARVLLGMLQPRSRYSGLFFGRRNLLQPKQGYAAMARRRKQRNPASYRWSQEKTPRLRLRDRVLLYLTHRDQAAGRVGKGQGWYSELKETLFEMSPSFMHAPELVLWNVLLWEELREYGHPDEWGEGGIELPPAVQGLGAIPGGIRQSFRLSLRTLWREELIYPFRSSMRAWRGIGGKNVPIPEIWSPKNRDKLSDISAISLTEAGFRAGRELARKYTILFPWQLHQKMIDDRKFAEFLMHRPSSEPP